MALEHENSLPVAAGQGDIAAKEQTAKEVLAALAAIESEYHSAELSLQRIADRRTEARAAAEKASGRVHLARLRAMLAGG